MDKSEISLANHSNRRCGSTFDALRVCCSSGRRLGHIEITCSVIENIGGLKGPPKRQRKYSFLCFRMLETPVISVLGQDPNRTHRINANSFQQNAITTVNGWQYVAFYTSNIQEGRKTVCHANLSRRQPVILENAAEASRWETLTFEDYEQTADDGHNTISIGVCKGDGTIHIAFDHHCDL